MKAMTKDDDARLMNLSYEELEHIEQIALEWANRAGEIRVEKYIKNQFEFCGLTDAGGIRYSYGEIIQNPDGIRLFINEYPPRLKQYSKTKFSEKLGYGNVRETWRWLMRHGAMDIISAGYKLTRERKVVIFKYHFKQLADPDNMNAMFLTDMLRDWRLIDDDNMNQIIQVICGLSDPENPGTEIIIISEKEFLNNPQIMLPEYKVKQSITKSN